MTIHSDIKKAEVFEIAELEKLQLSTLEEYSKEVERISRYYRALFESDADFEILSEDFSSLKKLYDALENRRKKEKSEATKHWDAVLKTNKTIDKTLDLFRQIKAERERNELLKVESILVKEFNYIMDSELVDHEYLDKVDYRDLVKKGSLTGTNKVKKSVKDEFVRRLADVLASEQERHEALITIGNKAKEYNFGQSAYIALLDNGHSALDVLAKMDADKKESEMNKETKPSPNHVPQPTREVSKNTENYTAVFAVNFKNKAEAYALKEFLESNSYEYEVKERY